MIDIILIIVFMSLGIVMITKGSDWMTDSLIPVAHKLGTSYIAVASILVSVMLSIPEIFVAIYAFVMGHPGIGLGVIIGSIICNIGLMTGLSAMIKPLSVDGRVVIRDGVFALVIAVIVFIFGFDLSFSRPEGLTLLVLFIPYVVNVWFFERWETMSEKKEELREIKEELDVIGLRAGALKPSMYLFFIGSAILLIGSYFFSDSLIRVAKFTGVSDVLIGLTIGAIGPSIPNIVSAVHGTLKNYTKIAITETFGSDIFTLLVTLGLLAVLSPFSIDKKWLFFDIPMMIFMTVLMMFFILKGRVKHGKAIERHEGAVLVLAYIVFLVLNILYLS
ncbi:MAG: sodium:calcium antiporter [Nanoarchaeota archaeon]|nr:sodium:calcium antiporter [Nanoarchaeota archaeon]MBU1005325.1 sodium:calcium antiporter [Nanoarchaeota archaeon]MBU1945503.1 sodium:calcium antiporter [Nanoarchaeota archaeon]